MKTNLIEELKWRGMLHDAMPGTEEQLLKEMTTGYVGFDPTADSLHIGNLVPIMLLKHLQVAGHKPIALAGGATGMIGDPSGKSAERNLLDETTLRHNTDCIKQQLKQFLDFDCGANSAVLLNNLDWFKEFSFLDFIRDVGKHITVSYMIAKESVKKRLETGMSFTEFTYQLAQGYDFYHLNKEMNCKLQMGGADQWGNMVTGTELIRRKASGEAYAVTCPLITKADGGKFGKTESGNVWLDAAKTSPYKFYQFWLNATDVDAASYIRIFTMLPKSEIEAIEQEHAAAPHLRLLQKQLAAETTKMVHSEAALEDAITASNILFNKAADKSMFEELNEQLLLDVFEGVPHFNVNKSEIENKADLVSLLSEQATIFKSKGEARRSLKENAVSINKVKVKEDAAISTADLIHDKYIVVQKGKKNYFLIHAVN